MVRMAVDSHTVYGQDGCGFTHSPWSGWLWVHTQSMVSMAVGSHTVQLQLHFILCALLIRNHLQDLIKLLPDLNSYGVW